jgi:stalled ribosome alternative rescue factor ArfA
MAKPNAQHKALRQCPLFRPKVERDRRRPARHPKHRNRASHEAASFCPQRGLIVPRLFPARRDVSAS